SEDHVLRRDSNGMSVLRLQQVVCREHEESCLSLSLGRERYVDSHLVTVEVSVIRRTYERMELQGSSLNKSRLKCLYSETVERRRSVEKYGMLLYNILKHV